MLGDVWMKGVENMVKSLDEEEGKVRGKGYEFRGVWEGGLDRMGWEGLGGGVKGVGVIGCMLGG